MTQLQLPTLTVRAVRARAPAGLALLNRDPAPQERHVPAPTTIALEISAFDGLPVDAAFTRVWVADALAFDGAAAPPVQPDFAGPHAGITPVPHGLRLTLHPTSVFGSEQVVPVRVVSRTVDGGLEAASIDETYAFVVADQTAPRLVAARALGPALVRLVFDEGVAVADVDAMTFAPTTAPAVPVGAIAAQVVGRAVDVRLDRVMSPGAGYRAVLHTGAALDHRANSVAPPFNAVAFTGYAPAAPERREFSLWRMLPRQVRAMDASGDLRRFVACLQEVTDLLLARVDALPDLWSIERAPERFLDRILVDLGNPFDTATLSLVRRRQLAEILVRLYQLKGTEPGIRDAVRFFVGVEIDDIVPYLEPSLILGESELGVDWVLGPSTRFALYAFDVIVPRVLTETERRLVHALVELLKPGHTHFVRLIEPVPPETPEHWELGVSELGETTDLH